MKKISILLIGLIMAMCIHAEDKFSARLGFSKIELKHGYIRDFDNGNSLIILSENEITPSLYILSWDELQSKIEYKGDILIMGIGPLDDDFNVYPDVLIKIENDAKYSTDTQPLELSEYIDRHNYSAVSTENRVQITLANDTHIISIKDATFGGPDMTDKKLKGDPFFYGILQEF